MKILFTGFEPFDGGSSNPSYECLRGLPPMADGVEFVTMELPVSFRRAPERLLERMKAERPDAVICLGLAANREKLSLEKVGLNYAHARIPDNDGMQPRDLLLDPAGPAAYFSTLPVVPLAEMLNRESIPAEISLTAGAYVCNCLLYRLLAVAGTMPAGFIHVPGTEKMTLETMTRAMMQTAACLAAESRKGGSHEIPF